MQQKKSPHVHSLNTSPAKQKYSFSKDQRFRYQKPTTDAYYLPSTDRDRRSALIGYGQRSLGIMHTQKQYEQIPHAYQIPSTLNTKKGNAFHGGRYQYGGYMEILKNLNSVPGPNNYNVPTMMEKKGVSLKSRLPDYSLKQIVKVPGPGAYSVPSTMKVQQQKSVMDSRFNNPSSVKISRSLDISRRKEPVTFHPGPGQYDVQKYGIGNPENPYGHNQFTKFTKGHRDPIVTKQAVKLPGPAEYKIFSEFD